MFKLFLFLHLTGLAVWLGAMVVVAGILLALKKDIRSSGVNESLKKILRFFNMVTHPSATIVLITGLVMRFSSEVEGKGSLWLSYMQDFGSLIVLGSIIALTILGKRAVKNLDGKEDAATASSLSKYANGLFVSAFLVISVLFVVALKLGNVE
ncbi:hypothetical protein [Ectobacillus sp. sgz5001026]|uniref:hypothetical protein n=1 Tax=Ectobacillus sp. sgz5001026 TaxID=3242473 RepID=UPI0036D251D8